MTKNRETQGRTVRVGRSAGSKNVFDFRQKQFLFPSSKNFFSATYVFRAAKLGSICLGNVYKSPTGSARIDKTRTGSNRIGLRPLDKTQTGSEKNRMVINFPQNGHVTSHDQVLAEKYDCLFRSSVKQSCNGSFSGFE